MTTMSKPINDTASPQPEDQARCVPTQTIPFNQIAPLGCHAEVFLGETIAIANQLSISHIEQVAHALAAVKFRHGRVFCLGLGGGAAHASHMVNDLRALCGVEAYAPTDNVAQLTALANDHGFNTIFAAWLCDSHLNYRDAILVFSVGGGDVDHRVSVALVEALDYAQRQAAVILGIVGRDGGKTAEYADVCVIVPTANPDRVTPHTEGFQSVIAHAIVSHPMLQTAAAKWESMR